MALLTPADLDEIREQESIPAQEEQLSDLLGLPIERAEDKVARDFLFLCMKFGEEAGFSDTKVAAMFNVAKKVFDSAATLGKASGAWPTLEESYDTFRALMVPLCSPEEDGGTNMFTVKDLEKITGFMSGTFYRNYKLYACAFAGMKRNVLSHVSSVALETPVPPEPLAGATEIQPMEEKEARPPGEDLAREGKDAGPSVRAEHQPVIEYRIYNAMEASVSGAKEKAEARQQALADLETQVKEAGGGC